MKTKSLRIQQLNTQAICRAHRHTPGRVFEAREILPDNICPWLYHSLYPYFLGAIYGATYDYNKKGDVHVGCPAEHGVDCVVRRRKNSRMFKKQVGANVKTVCYADVVKVGACPHGHRVGGRYIFPNVMKDRYLCPAGFNNIFPFLKLKPPSCINLKKLRCPDWKDTIQFNIAPER
jgi:uncharacterized repeat protein (TIGR04076 family)